MRFSDFFIKTLRHPPADEESANARLLVQGGFVHKLAAGVYTFLPLGLRVLNKIENIVREEMNLAGGIELLMPALQPKENWDATGRWSGFDALYKTESNFGGHYALGPTHEEVIYPLLKHYISSYKDLPLALYQIQTKFRDEKRPKSGLLRGREFRMKDLYSFHENEEERNRYYETMRRVYLKIFRRLGLKAIETRASGGTFSEFSAEFQILAPAGEDTIYYCEKCRKGVNKEISIRAEKCQKCAKLLLEGKAIEVGNIFPLKEKFAKDFNLTFKDKAGQEKLVKAGCYGLGTSRALGAIAEVSHDERGVIWPESVAPFRAELIKLHPAADRLYQKLEAAGAEVLYDERAGASAGEKFADADLIGLPWRIVVSEKTAAAKKVEVKERGGAKTRLISERELLKMLKSK